MAAAVWTCPECKRPFGSKRRAHACSPGLTEAEYFATGPPHERPVYDRVRPIVDRIAADHGGGDLIVEFVAVGVFFKRRRNFAELRPLTRWVALSFVLPRSVEHPKIARKARSSRTGPTTYHVVNLRTPGEVDDQVEAWLLEAYLAAAPRS